MTEMRGLTIWQPYATLLAIGAKPHETRSWATNYRGLVAIHASMKPTRQVYKMMPTDAFSSIVVSLFSSPEKVDFPLPTGAVIGYGELVACHKIDDALISSLTPEQLLMGDYTPGRFAWEFRDIVVLEHPVKMRGAQGLWRIKNEDEILLKGTA